jgi:hypothetical protein
MSALKMSNVLGIQGLVIVSTLDHTVWVMVRCEPLRDIHTNGCIGLVLHNKMVCIHDIRYVILSTLFPLFMSNQANGPPPPQQREQQAPQGRPRGGDARRRLQMTIGARHNAADTPYSRADGGVALRCPAHTAGCQSCVM